MDTKDFLDTVLPAQGRKCIGLLSNKVFTNYFGNSTEWAVEAATRISNKSQDGYFALSGYGADNKRTQDNVVAVRSFWLDIDTQESKPKEKYATRKVALVEVEKFRQALGLSKPFVVSSGYGLHIYWPCEQDMAGATWKQIATLLKTACAEWGLAVDPARTCDSASVLRPPGTKNYKHGTSRDVKLVQVGDVTTLLDFQSALAAYLGEQDVLANMPERFAENINSDLMTKREYPPSDPDAVAAGCGIVGLMRDTLGVVDQPTWYGVIGVLAHTVGGDARCHDWSVGDSRYTKQETDAKIAQAKGFGPTSCAKLGESHPDICKACPHFGEYKSPIQAGWEAQVERVIEEVLDPETVVGGAGVDVVLPYSYGWGFLGDGSKEKVLYYNATETVEGEQVTIKKKLSSVKFYPTARIASQVGSDQIYSMNIRAHVGPTETRDFLLDHATVMSGYKDIIVELGMREIVIDNAASPRVESYLKAWVDKLRTDYAKTMTVKQFGWNGDTFVVGDDILTRGGPRKAVVTREAQGIAQHLTTKGELQPWVDAVDTIYNHPGQQALQFCILSAFAAPLFHMYGETGGVTVYAYSAGSGYGKSTAQTVALSAWGCGSDLIIRGKGGATDMALYQIMGTYKNLPIVMDEMTSFDVAKASELVYATSSGKGKIRLRSDSTIRETLDWSTISMMSGNTRMTDKLSSNRANAEAEIARVWEFSIDQKGAIDPNDALTLFNTFNQNYGHAGRAYARYLVENREKVEATLMAVRQTFNARASIDQSERFWSALHAAVLTSLAICNKLEILKFDRADMEAWIIQQLAVNRNNMVASVSQPIEQFADMLSDVWGGVLVTKGEGNLLNGVYAQVEKDPHGPITGRSIIEDRNTQCGEALYISVSAVKDWCNKKGVSYREIQDALIAAGAAAKDPKRISLGKGTSKYSGLGGPVKCLDIKPSAVRAIVGNHPLAATITAVYSATTKQGVV